MSKRAYEDAYLGGFPSKRIKASTDELDFPKLRRFIQECPIIDNHAHNLLKPNILQLDQKPHTLEIIASEATGSALDDAKYTLALQRAVAQLQELYKETGENENAWDLASANNARLRILQAPADLISRCLDRTHCILIDDGLGNENDLLPINDHPVAGSNRRIVRIEPLVERILNRIIAHDFVCNPTQLLVVFMQRFCSAITQYIRDVNVVGFKSIICYRSGLDIGAPSDGPVKKTLANKIIRPMLIACREKTSIRLGSESKEFMAFVLSCLIETVLSEESAPMPLQLHTGFGDNDLDLVKSNPALLQPLIRKYPTMPFVLLHTGYPYTREAGYLASVYKNVYLDLGLAFPMLSRDGQVSVLRQCLELVPTNKLLWSTDGHFLPETFWLANKQLREAFEKVFTANVRNGVQTEYAAMRAVQQITFSNANELYRLGFSDENIPSPTKALTQHGNQAAIESSPTDSSWKCKLAKESVQFVSVQWIDYMGTMRCRILPVDEFQSIMESRAGISIAKANIGTLQNDTMTEMVEMKGAMFVQPDPETLKTMSSPGGESKLATVMASLHGKEGPLPECPRSTLEALLSELSIEFRLEVLVGFELEITILKVNSSAQDGGVGESFSPLTANHAWSTLTADQFCAALPVLSEIVTSLKGSGIRVLQFHAESGPGQYEIVLAPLPAVSAVDTFYQARQIISNMAQKHNLRATLFPKPFLDEKSATSGCHAHISLNNTEESCHDPESDESRNFFWTGVLLCLPELMAVAMPQAESYARVGNGIWTIGEKVAWDWESREVPLRRIKMANGERWEVRCLDGCANMYIALCMIVMYGLQNMRDPLRQQDEILWTLHLPTAMVNGDESDCLSVSHWKSDQDEVRELPNLPSTLVTALTYFREYCLHSDPCLEPMTAIWIKMKGAEQEMLSEMTAEDRRRWLIERY